MTAEPVKPWVKSWRGGSAKWRALPLITRGLSRELETHADDEGRIELPRDENPRAALWRLVGAHPRERQHLNKHLEVLERNGTLKVEQGLIYFVNWRKYQGVRHNETAAVSYPLASEKRPDSTPATTAAQPLDNRGATAGQPRRNRWTTAAQPLDNRGATAVGPKCAKSLAPKSQEGEGDKEEELIHDRHVGAGGVQLTEHDLFNAYRSRWDSRFPDSVPDGHRWAPQNSGDAPEWGNVLAKVREQARLSGIDERRVADAALDSFFADDFAAGAQFPPKLIVSKWAKYAQGVTSGGVTESRIAELRAKVKELQKKRDWAWGHGDTQTVVKIERQQERIKAQIRKLKGAA